MKDYLKRVEPYLRITHNPKEDITNRLNLQKEKWTQCWKESEIESKLVLIFCHAFFASFFASPLLISFLIALSCIFAMEGHHASKSVTNSNELAFFATLAVMAPTSVPFLLFGLIGGLPLSIFTFFTTVYILNPTMLPCCKQMIRHFSKREDKTIVIESHIE
jgi:flagellar biosynthesis protein FlhB